MESSASSPIASRKPISPVNGHETQREDADTYLNASSTPTTIAPTTTNEWSDNNSPCKNEDLLTLWRTPSGSQTPHRRHPHHLNDRHGIQHHHLQGHGLSDLAKPASPQGNSPRRVLHYSPRKTLSPRGVAPRSVRVVATYLLVAILAAFSTYFYLASSLLKIPSSNRSPMVTPQDAHSIMTRNMPKPAIRSSNVVDGRWWQHPIPERSLKEFKAGPRVIIFDSSEQLEWLSQSISSMAFPRHAIASGDGAESYDSIAILPMQAITNTSNSSLFAFGNSTSEDAGANTPEDKSDLLDSQNKLDDICEPAEPWQVDARPNCNSFHEIDMKPSESPLLFLGQGWFRSAWRLNQADKSVVIKMLRLEREFLDEYYELHRRDAVAMEHLTFSPFVMDVYGYCGQSAINEIADFREGVNALEQVDRRLRGQYSDGVMVLKLRLALGVVIGLYHVHYGIPGMPWEHNVTARPTMAHYDINPRNIAIVSGGKPKLNDFNIAEFLRYPKGSSTSETCGFPSRLHEPWWRAPEEMDVLSKSKLVDEKVDIYALGAVLFHILTTHSPRGKMKKERMDEIRQQVEKGIHPPLMEPWVSRKDPIVMAFKTAMNLCFHKDPRKRGTSKEIAIVLYRALENAPSIEELQGLEGAAKADANHDKHHRHDDKKKKKKTNHDHDDHHH